MDKSANIMSGVPPVVINPGCVIPAASPRSLSPSVKDVGIGRIKAPPKCLVPELKKESVSTVELNKMCFAADTVDKNMSENDAAHVSCSSSSSTCSRDSIGHGIGQDLKSQKSNLIRQTSAVLNAKVLGQKISRQGRSGQRWVADPKSQQNIRLTTGCVPIMNDGRILFITASRKHEWILPKGGWEMDETMEESAIRETFEEAGVIGVLGQKLSEIEYETRKSKKRRLEMEDSIKKANKHAADAGMSSSCSDVADDDHPPRDLACAVNASSPNNTKGTGSFSIEDNPTKPQHQSQSQPMNEALQKDESTEATLSTASSSDALARIRGLSSKVAGLSDETSSLASDGSASYSLVRMRLFPLYVSEVKTDWPESGRLRKVLHIDEAIKMLESRPEFRACLLEVKEKGLHLLTDPLEQVGVSQVENLKD
jgi:diphosphoinositol-polyphosphate diphosphatase